MAHWAEIDADNRVIRVTVGDNNDPNGDEGHQWLIDNLGGTWVKTSFNATIRKRFAGVGDSYNAELDAFIEPTPFPSWILDETTCQWKAPVEYPADGFTYYWNEETTSWVIAEFQGSLPEVEN